MSLLTELARRPKHHSAQSIQLAQGRYRRRERQRRSAPVQTDGRGRPVVADDLQSAYASRSGGHPRRVQRIAGGAEDVTLNGGPNITARSLWERASGCLSWRARYAREENMWEEDPRYQQENYRFLVWGVGIIGVLTLLCSIITGDWALTKDYLTVVLV